MLTKWSAACPPVKERLAAPVKEEDHSLPDIKVPSIVVVGADDTPFLAASDYMAAKIPGAQKAVIPAAGHAANIDQPEAFNTALMGFLDGLKVAP